MSVSLESLDLTPEQLELAREAVRKIAYGKWEDAGRPECDGCQFWSEAEQEWIARCYVPSRLPEPEQTPRPASRPRRSQPRATAVVS